MLLYQHFIAPIVIIDLYKSHQKMLKLLCRRFLGNRMLIRYPSITVQNTVGDIQEELSQMNKVNIYNKAS